MLASLAMAMITVQLSMVDSLPLGNQSLYTSNRAPLKQVPLTKLPVTAFKPGGWPKRMLELQRDGLTGNLGEISIWLTKEDNAWLNVTGKGKYGWEEVPYWLRGYARVAYILKDRKMLDEVKVWVEGTLSSARPDGDFGPIHNHSKGYRDLWAQMLMLQVLQSWYEYSGDSRVVPFMTNYFRWQNAIPDDKFLDDYWENSRGGDNLASVYWLYNITGDKFLLELGEKIHRNTANWRTTGRMPNYHVVNIAQCFREPAIYWQQSHDQKDLTAAYRNFDFIREKFGQVPGGMFGADENARPGHDDPHQATETCAFVEQIGSNAQLLAITGDIKWAANTEDVVFNSLPAAFTPDLRALRYLTAPNMISSDAENHAPGLANSGPFLLMNPFSSRCCQHNHTSAWVNYIESSWMATQDKGLVNLLVMDGSVTAQVNGNQEVTITTETKYPFSEKVKYQVRTSKGVSFPLYILIPKWANGAKITLDGKPLRVTVGKYAKIERTWSGTTEFELELPMTTSMKTWDQMKNSVSVHYGPLTFSLLIEEVTRKVDGEKTALWDSGFQPGVDQTKWPTFEILPNSQWNFGLAKLKFQVIHRPWPKDDFPFTAASVPIQLKTTGFEIPEWTVDQDGLAGILPQSPIKAKAKGKEITLIPMGAARLRISAFPSVE